MNDKVFLVQTDTTAGFLSKSSDRLANIKKRPEGKPFLVATSSFQRLKRLVRVPKKHRKKVRKSDKTTFIYRDIDAIRVVKNGRHHNFLERFGDFYSSSANISGDRFNLEKVTEISDLICEDKRGFFESGSSQIIKLGKIKRRRLR